MNSRCTDTRYMRSSSSLLRLVRTQTQLKNPSTKFYDVPHTRNANTQTLILFTTELLNELEVCAMRHVLPQVR